jgi:hypothetical protein
VTGSPAALENLAAALGTAFSTILIYQAGRAPHLVVVDRQTQAATDVYADQDGRFGWPWAEPAAVTDDPLTAAHRVTTALRGLR